MRLIDENENIDIPYDNAVVAVEFPQWKNEELKIKCYVGDPEWITLASYDISNTVYTNIGNIALSKMRDAAKRGEDYFQFPFDYELIEECEINRLNKGWMLGFERVFPKDIADVFYESGCQVVGDLYGFGRSNYVDMPFDAEQWAVIDDTLHAKGFPSWEENVTYECPDETRNQLYIPT